jgi:hypothetical protein
MLSYSWIEKISSGVLLYSTVVIDSNYISYFSKKLEEMILNVSPKEMIMPEVIIC